MEVIKIATVVKKIRPITDSYCIKCNRPYPIEDFYKSDNIHHTTGVMPYCKNCTKEMYQDNLKRFKDIRSALWVTCSEVGIPFIEKVYDNLMEKVKKARDEKVLTSTYNYWGNFISSYMGLKKKTDKWNSFGVTDVDKSEAVLDVSQEKLRKEKLKQFILDWGEQDEDDYAYLEYRWDFYTEDINLTPAQESLYRKLCISELDYRKAKENEESGKEQQESILKLMKTLKIDNFTQKKEKTLTEQMLERQIWEIENTTPAECEDLNKYKDFCNIESDWFKHVVSAVKNIIAGTKEYPLIPRKRD